MNFFELNDILHKNSKVNMMGYLLFCTGEKEKTKIALIARHIKDKLDIIASIYFTIQLDIETVKVLNTPPKQEKIRQITSARNCDKEKPFK